MTSRLHRSLGLALALACLLLNVSRAQLAQNSSPTAEEEAAAKITRLAEAGVQPQQLQWTPQISPGSLLAPTPDARRTAELAGSWARITLSSDQLVPSKPESKHLPDLWSRNRNYTLAWYVTSVEIEPDAAGRLWLHAEAVAHLCRVFVNHRLAGEHLGGYTPFAFDITDLVQPGANTITLWVQDESAVFDAGKRAVVSQLGTVRNPGQDAVAGIPGRIYFERRAATHLERVRVQPSTRQGQLTVQTWVRAANASPADAEVSHVIYEWPRGSAPVLQLPSRRITAAAAQTGLTETVLAWPEARRWSPEHPHLYTLRTTVRAGGRSETTETRFGFREFWIEGKHFMLNGQPIRLRGPSQEKTSHTFPLSVARVEGRRLFEFYKREFFYNAVRFHGFIHNREQLYAADEAGLLVVHQSSLWSSMAPFYERGADELLRNTRTQFAEWYWRDVNSPSVVIWDVENELLRFGRTPTRERWVLALDDFIKQLDPAAIVQHSGAAWINPQQETIHVHMQEQYNRVLQDWRQNDRVPLVLGEFWMGGRGETRLPSGHDYAGREDWHTEESRIYREKFLEMRNYGASGIMPFLMHQWLVKPNPAFSARNNTASAEALQWSFPTLRNFAARGLAPIVGFVWPRTQSAFAGTPLTKEIVICNDREETVTLTVVASYGGQREQWTTTLAPAEQQRRAVTFQPESSGAILVAVSDSHGAVIEQDRLPVQVIPADRASPPTLKRRLVVVPVPTIAQAAELRELGLRFETSATLPKNPAGTIVLVSPGAPRTSPGLSSEAVRQYLVADGRLLVLPQTEALTWLPISFPFWSSVRSSLPEFDRAGWATTTKDLLYSREIPLFAPSHPVFANLVAGDFREWSPRDGRVSDDSFVRPHAVGTQADGPYRVLAGATRRENATLIEARVGKGTVLLCQAQVLEQRAQPAARTLLINLLRYLDGPAWRATNPSVGIVGSLSPAQLAAQTGMAAENFVPLTKLAPSIPRLVLVGDHADTALVGQLAHAGHTVVVFSVETASRLPGYAAVAGPAGEYFGTRSEVADEPLFWGVATASFLPMNQSPARGILTRRPATARLVLGGLQMGPSPGAGVGFIGLETLIQSGPLAVGEVRGTGRLVVTTLEPWDPAAESHRQLLTTVLANAGVEVPNRNRQPGVVLVKPTVPLRLDGQLDDWTNDMEDRALSRFVHADPVVLASSAASSTAAGSDLDLSAVLYLLHHPQWLYFGGITFAADRPARVELTLGTHRILVDLVRKTLTIDGKPMGSPQLAVGRQPAQTVIDTRLLTLVQTNWLNGRSDPQPDAPGTTFEGAIAWDSIGGKATQALPVRFRLISHDGTALQLPQTDAEPPLSARFQ